MKIFSLPKTTLLILFNLTFLLFLSVAYAEYPPVHVEWTYSSAAISFVLYEDGVEVCTSPASNFQMDCDVFFDGSGAPKTFTMTAIDPNGVESPHSAPFTLTLPTSDGYGGYVPQADLQVSATSGEAPLAISFDASQSSDLLGTIVSYEWDFGNGDTASGSLIDYTYTIAGTYVANLTVTDDSANTNTVTATITVNEGPPPANIPPTAVLDTTLLDAGTSNISFDASGSSDTDGTIASYVWNFGDGSSGNGVYAEHQFVADGDYLVHLTVIDNQGASAQDQIIITVEAPPAINIPPTAIISASIVEKIIHLEWDYPTDNPDLAGFRLYQNDNLVCETTDPDARMMDCTTYIESETMEFYLIAFFADDSETAESEIFSFDSKGLTTDVYSGNAPLSVYFNGNESIDADGTISSFFWNFGDGDIDTAAVSTHTFTEAGEWTITLTATDNAGDTNSVSETVIVTDPNLAPVAHDGSLIVTENSSTNGTLSASDSDNDPLTFSIVSNGSKGTAHVTNIATGAYTYTPNNNASGTDTFFFKVNDGKVDSNYATITVTINQVTSDVWTDLVGVSANGNTITKTADDSWGNGGAASIDVIAADGSVDFLANETDTYRMCGLSALNADANYDTIDYAIYLRNNATFTVYENGSYKGAFGSFAPSDRFSVERSRTTILYKKNGSLFYTSTNPSTADLLVDTSIYSTGGTIADMNITDGAQASNTDNVWTDLIGVSAVGNTITKTADDSWGNGGAASIDVIAADGSVDFLANETDTYRMCGLSALNADANYDTIDYAIYLRNNATFTVYENGSYKGAFGSFAPSDRFSVERSGTTILYKKNGVLFYTSTQTSSGDLLVDAALFNPGATIDDMNITGGAVP